MTSTRDLLTTLSRERGEPCARVTVKTIVSAWQAVARQLGGWAFLRTVGMVRAADVRDLQGRHRHALVVVHGQRRGVYYLALHWTTAARKLGGCLLLVRVDMPVCRYCGRLHNPAATTNDRKPVCAKCAGALLRVCPSPLFTPAAEAQQVFPARRLVPAAEAAAIVTELTWMELHSSSVRPASAE